MTFCLIHVFRTLCSVWVEWSTGCNSADLFIWYHQNEHLIAMHIPCKQCDVVHALLCNRTVNLQQQMCSHNYQFAYCWHYVITIANEVSAFYLTSIHELNFAFVNLRRRSVVLLTLFCIFKQSVNQLHWSETIDLTISQMIFSFSCYVWKQSNMVNEKRSTAIHRMCSNLCDRSCCLVRQQGKRMFMFVISITGILYLSVLNPTSVRVLTVDCV